MVRMSMQVGDSKPDVNFVGGDAGRESITRSLDSNVETSEEIEKSIVDVQEEEKKEEEKEAAEK